MKLCSSDPSIPGTLRSFPGLFGPSFGQLLTLHAHSSRRPLNNSFSHDPRVTQRKQRDQLRRIFDESPRARRSGHRRGLHMHESCTQRQAQGDCGQQRQMQGRVLHGTLQHLSRCAPDTRYELGRPNLVEVFSLINAFSNALVPSALANPKVLMLTGDHGYFLSDAFRKARLNQHIYCSFVEQNMVGVAASLTKAGFKPILYGLAAFVPMRVLEQIKIDICYENLPVTLISDGDGLVYSHLGSSHQSTEEIACIRAIPSPTVLSPADRFEMAATMQLAMQLASPIYLHVGKSDRVDVHLGPVSLKAGELLQLRKGTQRIALLATGSTFRTALELANQGFDAGVWNVLSIKLLSRQQLAEITSRVDCVITLEEHSVMGGLGANVSEEVTVHRPLPVCRIGIEERISAYCGTWEYLFHEHRLDFASLNLRIDDFCMAFAI